MSQSERPASQPHSLISSFANVASSGPAFMLSSLRPNANVLGKGLQPVCFASDQPGAMWTDCGVDSGWQRAAVPKWQELSSTAWGEGLGGSAKIIMCPGAVSTSRGVSCHDCQGWCCWLCLREARDTVKYPETHRMSPRNKELSNSKCQTC